MLVVLSPAKSLDYDTLLPTKQYTQPLLTNKSSQLVSILRQCSVEDLIQLMSISNQLALLNLNRFQAWQPTFNTENSRPAIFAFNGDVYEGLQAYSLSDRQIQFAQNHIRILSGLYGVLRPLDLMQPYRLEMGTPLSNPEGKNLYQFWRAEVTSVLNQSVCNDDSVLLNLASDEYFKSIDLNSLKAKVIQPVFQDFKNNAFKVIGFYAKKGVNGSLFY